MYDFTDPRVRDLVAGGHFPEEVAGDERPDGTLPLTVICVKDRESWPCAATTQLRDYLASTLAKDVPSAPGWMLRSGRGTRGLSLQ